MTSARGQTFSTVNRLVHVIFERGTIRWLTGSLIFGLRLAQEIMRLGHLANLTGMLTKYAASQLTKLKR